MSNLQGCWNWFDTRNGRAQREADAIGAAINQVCLTQPVDPDRIAIAGFSAGAGMATLLATRQPAQFKAVIMHSGIAPGVAHSSATALSAMRGRRAAAGAAICCDCAVPARNQSLRGGSMALAKLTRRCSRPDGRGGALPGLFRWSAIITSRQTGAAPLVPDTAFMLSPSRLPTHTATVKRSV